MQFQLTRLMRGVTLRIGNTASTETPFQLTRLMRGVTGKNLIALLGATFLLTRLMRGVTVLIFLSFSFACSFQLTRLMRGVTQGSAGSVKAAWISTHTPHARRD